MLSLQIILLTWQWEENLLSSIWWNGPIWLTKPNQQWPDHEAVANR